MGSLNASTARKLADVYNGKNQVVIFPNIHKIVRDIVIRIMFAAASGSYEILYRLPAPLPVEAVQAFRDAGYSFVLEGFTYRIGWRDA